MVIREPVAIYAVGIKVWREAQAIPGFVSKWLYAKDVVAWESLRNRDQRNLG
jgi:hypothetical protein